MVERTFEGKKVYYSGSIKGAPEADPEFAWKLVQYMIENGAEILSEHVAARSKEEMDTVRARNIGMTVQEMLAQPEPWFGIRRQDLDWVDEASHVVAVINAPSHGVGMELEHAILKPRLGLNTTPILCLVHEDLSEKVSFMIRGVSKGETPYFYIETYTDLETAKSTVSKFLMDEIK